MTNKATEQDKEATSVDNNEAAMTATTKNPEDTKNVSTQDNSNASSADVTGDTTETVTEATEATDPTPEIVKTEPVETTAVDDSAIVPGSLSRALKQCRDEADISLAGAAEEMRLPPSVVKALEEENFADLPDPPYVRGYLRSYARLNDSDPNDLINRYETLRGADPQDIASFTPVTPRYQAKNKKTLSPTTVKLAGFSLIILLLVVLSMIPVVSQWASDTWQSFSEPQNQRLATTAAQQTANERRAETNTETSAAPEQSTQQTETPDDTTDTAKSNTSTTTAASKSDTATPDDSEQLALNPQSVGTSDTASNTAANNTPAPSESTGNDDATAEVTTQDNTPAQTDTASNTAANNTTSEGTDGTQPSKQTADTSEAASPVGNSDSSTADQNTATTAATTEDTADTTNTADETAAAEAARQQAQEDAEKAAAKAEADRRAAQQAALAQQGDQFQQPIDGNVLIHLVFTQSVWMSIKDGRGKTIFSALSSAGTRKELKASTPLQFKVGNAPGVQIYLNGQLIDQKPYTRGSVATFRAN